MAKTLHELCESMENCALRLEDEIRTSIESCHEKLLTSELTDTKIALEKAKDYHSKEIIKLLSGITTSIKQIVFHEYKIKQLNVKNKLSQKEPNEYSYVKRQVGAFSNREKVLRRELRRTASETSVYCLNTWEFFLKSEEFKKETLYSSSSLPNINIVPKRHSARSNRKQKKLISSTFENILEDDEVGFKPMKMFSEESTNVFTRVDSNWSNSEINNDFNLNPPKMYVDERTLNQQYQERNEDIVFPDKLHITDDCQKNRQMYEFNVNMENGNLKEENTLPKIVGFVVSYFF